MTNMQSNCNGPPVGICKTQPGADKWIAEQIEKLKKEMAINGPSAWRPRAHPVMVLD